MSNQVPTHEWIESVLNNPTVRERVLHVLTAADTFAASQLAENLMRLRNQQRQQAYTKIFEARAKVAEDLLALQTSLSSLIHFSAVAGEETRSFVGLMNNVVNVTRKLSVFGEDDANGDGLRDTEATQVPGQPQAPEPGMKTEQQGVQAPSLDLEVDTAPMAPDNQPEPKPTDVLPPSQIQQDPDDVTDEDAKLPGQPEAPKKEAPAPVVPTQKSDEAEDQPSEDDSAAFDNAEDTDADDGAPEPEGPDTESDESAPEDEEQSDDESNLHKEFGKIAKKAKSDKKGLYESTLGAPAEASAESDNKKPAVFRFAYRGVRGDSISTLVANKVYYFKPAPDFCDGDANKLNVLMRRYLEKKPGYTAALQKLNALVKAGKVKATRRVTLSKKQLREITIAPELVNGQLGATELNPGTGWRWRGVGLQKLSNQDVCLWLEVGNNEYALVPNPAVFKDKTIEDVDGPIQGNLKKLSYTQGLSFILAMIKTKKLTVLYQGKIQA